MKLKRAYRATDVNEVQLEKLLQRSEEGRVTVGLDIGKSSIYAVVRWPQGSFERPWRTKNPQDLHVLLRHLCQLAERFQVVIALESTGTYGDALRLQTHRAGLCVHRVSAKAAHDYAEVFDGVPSQHDGKDAAVVAELAAFGKSQPWPLPARSVRDAQLAYWVDRIDLQQRIEQVWVGRLESLVARHWPEALPQVKLKSLGFLKTLAQYGSPQEIGSDPQAALDLARWSRRLVTSPKIVRLVASARSTTGWPLLPPDIQRLQEHAQAILAAHQLIHHARRQLTPLVADCPTLTRMATVVGVATACVLWMTLGDPHAYPSGEAYRKAMGLNLKEHSSGKYQGKLRITKRGPALARRWIYFAALRYAQQGEVRDWFQAQKSARGTGGKRAVIGIARKLALALHAVATRQEPFEIARLFPGKPGTSRTRNASAVSSGSAAGGSAPCNPRDLSPGTISQQEKE